MEFYRFVITKEALEMDSSSSFTTETTLKLCKISLLFGRHLVASLFWNGLSFVSGSQQLKFRAFNHNRSVKMDSASSKTHKKTLTLRKSSNFG